MNTKNRIIGKNGLLAAGTAVLMIASASAAFTTSRTIVNHNRYDTVEIGLQIKNIYDEDKDGTATPNEDIFFSLEVANKGAEAYIRIRPEITVVRKDGTETHLETSRIISEDEDWKKDGDCFYGMKKLKENGSLMSGEHFRIPQEWENEYVDGTIRIKVVAEAVQARNFGNENLIESWKDLNVEKTVRSRTYNMEVKQL
jgi:hypothetical protein